MFFKSISSFKKKLWWLIIIPVGLITSLFSWHKVERDVFQIWKLVLGKRFICLFIYAFILFIHLIIHQSNARYVFGFSKWCAFCWMLKIKYKYTWFLLSRSLWLIVKKKKWFLFPLGRMPPTRLICGPCNLCILFRVVTTTRNQGSLYCVEIMKWDPKSDACQNWGVF